MRRIAWAISLALFTACAGSYKASYVAGAVTKQFATESYDVYSGEFNNKLDECSPENNGAIKTKRDLDKCMTPMYEKATHEKIETASKAYGEAAKIHTEVMIVVDATDDERLEATKKVLDAAMGMLSLFPEGEKLVRKLKSLIGAK
jgi:hypothetical protein